MFQCNVIGIDTAKSRFEIFECKDEKVQRQRSLPRKKIAEFFQKMEKKNLIMEACHVETSPPTRFTSEWEHWRSHDLDQESSLRDIRIS